MWHCYLELARIRLTAMVLATTVVGYVLAPAGPICWTRLVLTVLGTGLAAIGAGAFNQLLEIDRDAKMQRTCHRPLPAGSISPIHALLLAFVATVAGLGVLVTRVNSLTALLGLANVLIYTLVYTPLKSRTPLSTLAGAICGATPPVMGWTGAADHLAPEVLVLAAIVFVWQVPHSLSQVWLYRSDYRRAGYRLLPAVDLDGRLTCPVIAVFSLMLSPLCLSATFFGMTGSFAGMLSFAASLLLFAMALQLWVNRTRRQARRMFFATIGYLPLLLLLIVADAAVTDRHQLPCQVGQEPHEWTPAIGGTPREQSFPEQPQ
jgi:heme o synthase